MCYIVVKDWCGWFGCCQWFNESVDVDRKSALILLVLTQLRNQKRKFERENRRESEPELHLNGNCAIRILILSMRDGNNLTGLKVLNKRFYLVKL